MRSLSAAAVAAAVCAGVFSANAQDVQTRRYSAAAPDVQVREVNVVPDAPMVGEQPFSLAIMPTVETPDASWDVVFFRLGLFVGRHRCVYGLDIGVLGGMADQEMSGIGLSGLFNDIGWSGGAFQVAGVFNRTRRDFCGLQLAMGFCWTEGEFDGLQIALANKSGRLGGVQIGAMNAAEVGSGLQIGVVNYADRLEGFQIGVLNINRDSSIPVFPILNCAF